MKEEYLYLIYLFAIVLGIFIIMTGIVLYEKFSEKKRKAFQEIDEQIRNDIEDSIAFLEDETDSRLSEEKRNKFKILIITRLKKEQRNNKEIIKKLVREEILRLQTEKKEQLRFQAVKQIFQEAISAFRLEFFKKVKRIISKAQTTPKTRNSRIQEQRRKEAEEQKRQSREEQQEKERSERERQKNEQERKKETEERIKTAREKEEALEKERQEQEKKRKEQEEQERKEQERQQKEQQKQKQSEQVAKAAAVGGRGGNGGR